MLLEFRVSNYKSFKDELVFSMIPAPKQKGLDYSILREKIGRHTEKALCSAVIYGPNASGKTNIIGAMDTFKCIVLRGNIRNDNDQGWPNKAAHKLELIPNINLHKPIPTSFSISFTANGMLINYSFSCDLGEFLNSEYPRKILAEELSINGSLIFSRNETISFGDLLAIKDFTTSILEHKDNEDIARKLSIGNLDDEELFLTNGFKSLFSSKLVSLIIEWLTNKFNVIYRADAIETVKTISNKQENAVYIDGILSEAANEFGINSNNIGYALRNENETPELCSVFTKSGNLGKNILMPAELFESYGTVRFVNTFPLVVDALVNGGILVIDEFDASIHPMALMSVINLFHNDEINIHHAQLIFDTHNPIFLNSALYRRDEIKFVERDDKTHESTHYSLSDFGTSGQHGVRNGEDYMKNYFLDRYGAIKEVDFSPIFLKLMNREGET